MTQESAVQFDTDSRIHLALAVKQLDRSICFYRTLFGQEPTKIRPHYAKFEIAEPPVNLALNQVHGKTGPNHPVAHFGIQVKSTAAVREVADRLRRAAFTAEAEENVTCCYAVQNKVQVMDPEGNKWEVYVVLEDDGGHHHSAGNTCCPGLPAIMEAVQQGDMSGAMASFEKVGGMSACSCLTKAAT